MTYNVSSGALDLTKGPLLSHLTMLWNVYAVIAPVRRKTADPLFSSRNSSGYNKTHTLYRNC